MNKRLLILSIFFIYFVGEAKTQTAWFTNFNSNIIAINPAYSGNQYHLSVRGQYKTMWTAITNAPATSLISAHAPIGLSSSSAGIILSHDNFGTNTSNLLQANYAYRFQTSIGRIAAGLSLSVLDYNEHLTGTHPIMPNDPALAADYSEMFFNGGFGLAWENENGYAGVAIPAIKELTKNKKNDSLSLSARQINFNGAYTFILSENWKLTPAVYYGYLETLPSQMAIIFALNWKNTLSLNAGYRSNNVYSLGFDYSFFDNFLIGYTYDHFATSLSAVAGGGHELVIGFDLLKPEGE